MAMLQLKNQRKRDTYLGMHPYHTAAILDLKRGWTGIKITKVANDHCCVPLCNNEKRYDSGKDLSYLNFPSDK